MLVRLKYVFYKQGFIYFRLPHFLHSLNHSLLATTITWSQASLTSQDTLHPAIRPPLLLK